MSSNPDGSNDDESFRSDDLKFRSYSTILKAFPEKNLFQSQRPLKLGPEDISTRARHDRNNTVNLHKVAFLLTQHREVVAAMPARISKDISIILAATGTNSEVKRDNALQETTGDVRFAS